MNNYYTIYVARPITGCASEDVKVWYSDITKLLEFYGYNVLVPFAEQEEIHVSSRLSLATRWFYGRSEKHPFSVDISRMGLTNKVSLIYRTFDASYVSRVVGQGFTYDNTGKAKVKRRRVIPVQEGFPIRFKKTPSQIES